MSAGAWHGRAERVHAGPLFSWVEHDDPDMLGSRICVERLDGPPRVVGSLYGCDPMRVA